MINSRTQLLDVNALDTKLSQLEAAMANRKTGIQRVGTYNIRSITSSTGNTYDWQGKITAAGQASGTYIKILNVTATAQNMSDLFAYFIPQMYTVSTAALYRYSDLLAAVKANTSYFQLNFTPLIGTLGAKNAVTWGVAIASNDNTTAMGLKFYVVSNDNVSISITEMN